MSIKPTIGAVSLHSCIRAHKIHLPLADLGFKTILFAEATHNNNHFWWTYDGCVKLCRNSDGQFVRWQIKNAIKTFEPLIDIWHVHNEPDFPVRLIREISKKPIVYDIHDMVSMRKGSPDEEEDNAFKSCDAVSVVSRKYVSNIIQRDPMKPCREVLSCLPREWMPKERATPYRGGIVYEGGLLGKYNTEFPCRNWAEVFKKIDDLGIQVWAFTGNPGVGAESYPGTIILGPVGYPSLLRELTRHEFGLVGSPVKDPMFDGALPNKMFEYMAAGLPMICMNAPDVSNFLSATGMGVTVTDVKEIPDAMAYMRDRKFRARVWKQRFNWTAETQIGKVVKLYEKITGKRLQEPIIPGEFKNVRKVPQTDIRGALGTL